jgi:hypothetical protein
VDSVRCSLSRQHYACPFSLIIWYFVVRTNYT